MDSSNPSHIFGPLDLEILDRVYEVACAHIEARDLYRDLNDDGARECGVRKRVFTLAGTGPVDFDAVCDKVLESLTTRPSG